MIKNKLCNLAVITSLLISSNLAAKELKSFDLPFFKGQKSLSLNSAVSNQKVVLNFWASWCTACIKELPELEALKKKYPKVLFVGINAEKSKKKIKRFLKRYKFSYSIVEDRNRVYSKSVGVVELPQTIVLGKNRKILFRGNRPPKEL